MVEVQGLEPWASCSQSRRSANWATPRRYNIILFLSEKIKGFCNKFLWLSRLLLGEPFYNFLLSARIFFASFRLTCAKSCHTLLGTYRILAKPMLISSLPHSSFRSLNILTIFWIFSFLENPILWQGEMHPLLIPERSKCNHIRPKAESANYDLNSNIEQILP